MKNFLIGLFFVILLSLPSVHSLLGTGYFPMHDDTQIGRVVAMGRSLREGQFPVRWVSDLGYGYGYPIFNFYGPLPYYFGGALYVLGVPALIATKGMMIVGFLLAAVTMYILTASTFGILPATLSALFLQYAPYHAVQLYVRGAIGELWAAAWFPLVLYGCIGKSKNYRMRFLAGSIGLAGVILSHTILGYVVVLFLCIALGVLFIWSTLNHKKFAYFPVLYIFLVGLGLSAFFWLPAFAEMRFTSVSSQIGATSYWKDHFVCIPQLWNSPWGFGGSVSGCLDGLSFKLGKVHSVLALVAIVVMMVKVVQKKSIGNIGRVSLGIIGISCLLLLSISTPVWEYIPGFAYIQYPWRFLTFLMIGLAGMIGWGFAQIQNTNIRLGLCLVALGFLLGTNRKLFRPQFTYEFTNTRAESTEELRFRVSKISDEYLPPSIMRPQSLEGIVRDTIQAEHESALEYVRDTAVSDTFFVSSPTAQDVLVRLADFPGWTYRMNGQYVKPKIIDGLPYVHVDAGRSSIETLFTDTPVRRFANILSIITICILIFYGKKTNA